MKIDLKTSFTLIVGTAIACVTILELKICSLKEENKNLPIGSA